MEKINMPNEETLKKVIFDLQEPVVFNNILQDDNGKFIWKLLQWNLLELGNKFGDMKLPFRVGYNSKSMHPQWEKQCRIKTMTFTEFLEKSNSSVDNNKWYYFDYKYMHEWIQDKPDLLNSFNWHRFGIEKDGHDSTLWIGNKGAHTNCHFDSYGCNLVAQIHGRKQWILLPPNCTNELHPTRVPYEESTIYSEFNFFSPTIVEEESILKLSGKVKSIVLEAGDVLLVPKGWWHYVESLNLTVSVNIWLPLQTDNESRLKEALVQLIINRIGKKVCDNLEETYCSLSQSMKILENSLLECKKTDTENISDRKRVKQMVWTAEELSLQYPYFVKLLPNLEQSELQDLLKLKRERFLTNINEMQETNISAPTTSFNETELFSQLSKDVVNTFCHPEIIDKVAELLLKTRYGNQ
ncbi:HSPB1-associated protein 1 [Polistes fuscatus]|uniref:HSPB1-associated protein 1 n=1 Tax=Polistes fuscatus TaxID=30207 RepID=UPI001CA90270|nr:HSPB1-associated protein 1 [Polistes fuscatus]